MWPAFLHPAGRGHSWAKKNQTHYTLRPRFLKAIPSSAGGCAAHLEIPSRPLICLVFDMHLSKSQALPWMPAHLNCSHLTRRLCVRKICPFGEGKGNTAPKMFSEAVCFNRLVSEMKGWLQIHPEDNVEGQRGPHAGASHGEIYQRKLGWILATASPEAVQHRLGFFQRK